MFFNRRKREESKNSELVPVTRNVLVKVWQAQSRRGDLRVHFGFRRVAGDGGEPYLSLTPETLLELPLAISKLAKAFSDVVGLDESLRVECGELAVLMEKVSQHQAANGSVEEKKPETGRILNLV